MKILLASSEEIQSIQGDLTGVQPHSLLGGDIEDCRVIKLQTDNEAIFCLAGYVNNRQKVRITSEIKVIDKNLVQTRNSVYRVTFNQVEPDEMILYALHSRFF